MTKQRWRTLVFASALGTNLGCSHDDGNDASSSGELSTSTSATAQGSSEGESTVTVSTSTGETSPETGSSSSGAGSASDSESTGGEPASTCEIGDGQCIFRHDTFGDEQLWTDVLRLHELVQTLPPTTALAVGLKIDADAVPPEVLANADLNDPATTVALLSLNAVVGVRAEVEDGSVKRIGITCALCHSDVDDSALQGVGHRLDGYANRDINPGLILSLTPGLPTLAEQLGVDPRVAAETLANWGPGRYDAYFNQDGQSDPVLIPPASGFAGVPLATYTGEGSISYWNAYVAVTQMGGHGNFVDKELGIAIEYDPDLVTDKLPALLDYQLSLAAPAAPAGSFDTELAALGADLFDTHCAGCHAGDTLTDAPTLHAPAETDMDGTLASRSKTGMYRTTPLRGAWAHPPYFHDGSAADFTEVVDHYNNALGLNLSEPDRTALEEFLRSL